MVYAQLRICPGEWDAQTPLEFWDINGSLNPGQTTWPRDSQQKKGTCRIVDFAVSADQRIKLKEGKKIDKYLDLARELRKLEREGDGDINRNRCARYSHQKIKRLEDLEIRGRVVTIQTTELLRSARILRVLETWGDLLSLKRQWKTIS